MRAAPVAARAAPVAMVKKLPKNLPKLFPELLKLVSNECHQIFKVFYDASFMIVKFLKGKAILKGVSQVS